ncbi:MAG TPA: hypothetical protein VHH36_09590, partial [Candidatus Thermoplasmatota archaeon]|nr:hypothetical protein [Candidatus Thermoplasmatota archaeon]
MNPTAMEGDAQAADRPQREVAQRVFAAEFNEAKHHYKESGDRSPSFVVSPFGAKVNRLFVVGVLTNVGAVGQTPGNYKAQVVDPTGTFYLWAGQFEPEASAQLANIAPPAIVAVTGKSRARDADTGVTYVSIRPESIRVVEKTDRDAWILEAARHSLLRLEALKEAQKLETPSAKAIEELGYPADVARADLARYAAMVRDALETLLPGSAERVAAEPSFAPAATLAPTTPRPAAQMTAPAAAPKPTQATPQAPKAPPPAAKPAENPHEALVLGFVEKLDDGKGAPWEDIVA